MNFNLDFFRRKPIVGVRKRVLSSNDVRWLSFLVALIVFAAVTVLFVDEITLSNIVFMMTYYWLTPPATSRGALAITIAVFVLLAPFLLPVVVYVGHNRRLTVSFYRDVQFVDDIVVFTLLRGQKIYAHTDLVYDRFPKMYAILGPYEFYGQGETWVLETNDFEVSRRFDYEKKIEWLEHSVSYWKTQYELLAAQIEHKREVRSDE